MASSAAKGVMGALGGAGTGAAIGTAIFPGIGTLIGAGLGGVAGGIAGGSQGDDQERVNDYQRKLADQRQASKETQYGLLRQMQGPQMTPAMQARIKALQDQSASSSLVEDPYFQKQRATLVQGGQQALSGVQNVNRGNRISGGFSNVGSASDIYDRLSGQLAGLGQDSVNLKDAKAQQAAQMEQDYQNSVLAFNNARQQAAAAIEAGDSAAAMSAINAAYEAKQQIAASDSQMLGSAMGGLAGLAGGLTGALGANGGGSLLGGDAGLSQKPSILNSNSYEDLVQKTQQQAPLPYSLMRKNANNGNSFSLFGK